MSNYYLEYHEDDTGDLVDISYWHRGCASDELRALGGHPCPDWPDYPVYCEGCEEMIHDPRTYEEYEEMGREQGKAVGSWVIDGNTTTETARRIVQGYEDGDPEIEEMMPAPLSGEWAGESLRELFEYEPEQDSLSAYENGYALGYWGEVLRVAQAMIGVGS